MKTETALPTAEQSAAAGEQQNQTAAPENEQQTQPEGEQKPEGEKKELTPEEREIRRLRRRIDNVTRKLYETRAQVPSQSQQQERTTAPESRSDDEPVQLTRAELDKLIRERAAELAPKFSSEKAEAERRQGIVSRLAKDWGSEKFDAYAADLDDAFGGLADASGKPKPATDAIFEAEDPKALIEYLADPANAEEAESIGSMPAVKAIRAIAKLEDKLAAAKQAASKRPERSNASEPLEKVRGGGPSDGAPDFRDTKAWVKWANEQERKGRI